MKHRVIRKEEYKQYSGKIPFSKIPHVSKDEYYVRDITLDGEAPKEYIRAYFYYKNCPRKSYPAKWHGYYAKFGSKSYPMESFTEYLINQIGACLGLNMNITKLVIINTQVRFLSQDFIIPGQKLIHGVEILAEYLEDSDFVDQVNKNKKTRRAFFTFELVEIAIKSVYPEAAEHILNKLVELLVFDAIVGNNDRHFYNWGLIGETLRSTEGKKPFFTPIYDSARALLWNITDNNVKELYKQHLTDHKCLDGIINQSKPSISIENNEQANHFELIEWLYNYNAGYKRIIIESITLVKEKSVINCIEQHSYLIVKERSILLKKIINLRFQKLRSILL